MSPCANAQPAIFADSSQADRLAQFLVQENDVNVKIVPLFSESPGSPDSAAGTYLELMETNTSSMTRELGEILACAPVGVVERPLLTLCLQFRGIQPKRQHPCSRLWPFPWNYATTSALQENALQECPVWASTPQQR